MGLYFFMKIDVIKKPILKEKLSKELGKEKRFNDWAVKVVRKGREC